ncbi:MAG: cytochrome c [Candidatus Sericytochromatia bacterium]|nr:cytochrome c [Candidatus Sericytochromatia bacterium]
MGAGSLAVGMLYLSGCRQQMADQPAPRPLEDSAWFKDGGSSRGLIAGTVARGQLAGSVFATGKAGVTEIAEVPMPVTKDLLERGRQRFNINCAVCHGQAGDGQSVVAKRMLVAVPSYHTPKLRTAPIGHFVNVIANGYGSMYSYAARVTPADRWAIAAYIRALQLSQGATSADVAAAQALK